VLFVLAWLDKDYPQLFLPGPGDPLEKLKADLKGLYR
jgi:hypothetical protein